MKEKHVEKFVDNYYYDFDHARERLKSYYLKEATFVWNGRDIKEREYIIKFCLDLPETTHKMDVVDIQPLPENNGSHQYVVCTSGNVIIDNMHTKTFFQTFILCEYKGKYRIINDCYRTDSALTDEDKDKKNRK